MGVRYPIIGAWHQDLTDNQYFEVVAVDEQARTVEIQYLGGEVSEFDFESWQQLPLIDAQPPEDAGAGYSLAEDEFDYYSDGASPESWNNPLTSIEPDSFPGIDDF